MGNVTEHTYVNAAPLDRALEDMVDDIRTIKLVSVEEFAEEDVDAVEPSFSGSRELDGGFDYSTVPATAPAVMEATPVSLSVVSPSKVQALFHAKLKAFDSAASLEIKTDCSAAHSSGLPPTPPTLTPDHVSTPPSAASTLLETPNASPKEVDAPFFFKPQLKRASDEMMPAEKQALKQQLKLQIPATSDHSLCHKRNAPAALPLMQEVRPTHRRARRNSLPSSPFVLVAGIEDDGDDDFLDTPEHLLFTGLDSALRTQRMLDSPIDSFPETPDSALFQPVPIKMMESLDDDDGYISDPGSAVARHFAEPIRAGPQIQRGKQLPFPARPTKAKPVSRPLAGTDAVKLRESRSARFSTLRRRYHDLPSKYGVDSPIRSPIARSPMFSPLRDPIASPIRVIRGGRSLFESLSKVGVSSPLAQRPIQGFA